MGCTPSKQSVCRNCNSQCSPVRRSYSLFSGHLLPREDNNSHRVVAQTSITTLDYLLLDPSIEHLDRAVVHVPRVLQEHVHLNFTENNSKGFALGVVEAKTWSKLIDEKINKIVPKTPVRTPPGEPEEINAWELMEGLDDSNPSHPPSTPLQNRKKETNCKLILYYTSIRGVRKTYDDCCNVRVILKKYGVRIDERDVSMHSGFKDELKELLGDLYAGGTLPNVFIGSKYIGGAEEIRRFHDEFQLDKVLEGCEMVVDGGCQACGDVRFLLCLTCSGSCKIYHELYSDEGKKEQLENYGFRRCLDCNENGLIMCPVCCD